MDDHQESEDHKQYGECYDSIQSLSTARSDSETSNALTDDACPDFSSRILLKDLEPLTLDTLPEEILMHICNYIDAKFIIQTLSRVCVTFRELFSGDLYWKVRISKQWPKHYPPVYEEKFDWKEACIDREECHQVWSQVSQTCHQLFYREGIFAPVDSVHLMKNGRLLATGSRDRYLNLIDVTKYDATDKSSVKKMKLHSDPKHHKGWIWTIKSCDDVMYTGSWDTYIKMWDLNNGVTEMNKFKCKSAILGLHVERNLIVGAGYNQFLYMIDPRDGSGQKKRFHSRPVLCVAGDDNYIVSGSEDKTLAIYDRRAGRVYKTIQMEEYSMDINLGDNQLWIGDKGGAIHLYNTTHGGFELIKSYDVGHTGKVTGIQYTRGALFTCSTDKTVKIMEPSRDPGVISTLEDHSGEVARLCYQGGVLATAGSESTVGLWIPKSVYSDFNS